MNEYWILAQQGPNEAPSVVRSTPLANDETETAAVTQNDPNATTAKSSRGSASWTSFIPLILIFAVMYLMLFRGPRKKQQQHKQMVQSLKKNDKVRTIGGIIGTVVDIKGDEITLKVDESNNTKIKVLSSAIGRNTSKDND